jgi:competence protein ComEC
MSHRVNPSGGFPLSAARTVVAAAGRLGRAVGAALGDRLADERARWVLWAPVLVGIGIGSYFGLKSEPPGWVGVGLAAFAAAAALAARPLGRRSAAVALAILALALVALGFAAGQARTARLATPMLAERVGPVTVTGQVVEVDWYEDGVRVVLEVRRLPGFDAAADDRAGDRARVRLRLRGGQPAIRPGVVLTVRAVLSPPPPPAAPHAFDFQRQAFFAALSAVGYGVGRAEIVAGHDAADGGLRRLWLERLRGDVAERVRGEVSGVPGAIIIALLTGERSEIPADVLASIRDAGLAHLLAISGMNIGLVAAFVFAVLRGGMALVPGLALSWPIKKYAAVGALAAAGFYTLLAGASVPTVRSFLMLAAVFLAILVDRQGISMRLVAWSALVILLVQPEALLGASFQLSFAAVVALVAAYEEIRSRRLFAGDRQSVLRRAGLYLLATALTSVIATLATTPYSVYHFNRMTWYGVVANMIAVPVNGLWVMPWAVATLVLMPFGLEGLALAPMAWGAALTVWTARTVAAWPGAVTLVPVLPVAAVIAFTLGGLWLCLWRRQWRGWGLALCGLGAVAIAGQRAPDLLIDGRGKLIAVRGDDGALTVSTRNAAAMSRETWLRQAGEEDDAPLWPRQGASADGRLACDPAGCVYRARGYVVAIARSTAAIDDDCRTAQLVVSTVPVRGRCPSAEAVIDRFDLWRSGAHAVWLGDAGRGDGSRPGLRSGIRIESVNGVRGRRPWVVAPSSRPGGRPSSGGTAPPDGPEP